jgi:hypothetical protein
MTTGRNVGAIGRRGSLAVLLAIPMGAFAQGPPAPTGQAVAPSGQQPVYASPQWQGAPSVCSRCGQVMQAPGAVSYPMVTIDQMVRMTGPELDQLFMRSPAGTLPAGRVRGTLAQYPGTRWAVPTSKVGRLIWQGKVVDPDQTSVVNRFFGVKMIRGDLYYGESWLDGKPAIIINYENTSWLYSPYRDEIREVSPGVYLGLMYDRRTQPSPTFKMYFLFESTNS